MKKLLLVMLLTMVLLYGCNQKSKPMYSEETQLSYIELDGYKAAIIDREFITAPAVEQWLDNIDSSSGAQGYYEYIYADPDSWDLFVLWPLEGGNPGAMPAAGSMRFAVEDGIVKLYFDSTTPTEDNELLLLVQAPLRGPWPTGSEIYVDDVQVTKAATAFNS